MTEAFKAMEAEFHTIERARAYKGMEQVVLREKEKSIDISSDEDEELPRSIRPMPPPNFEGGCSLSV